MSKKTLVANVYNKFEDTGITKSSVRDIIDATLNEVINIVVEEGEIRLLGFASLKVYNRKERKALHPITREPIDVPAKKSLKVSISSEFKDAIQSCSVVSDD
ncbi:MAG: HU family DNA-binding protein [Pseudomonadota bacterium]|nr:HU family DNA-binding protein [Pseudomonadota bacterium]